MRAVFFKHGCSVRRWPVSTVTNPTLLCFPLCFFYLLCIICLLDAYLCKPFEAGISLSACTTQHLICSWKSIFICLSYFCWFVATYAWPQLQNIFSIIFPALFYSVSLLEEHTWVGASRLWPALYFFLIEMATIMPYNHIGGEMIISNAQQPFTASYQFYEFNLFYKSKWIC